MSEPGKRWKARLITSLIMLLLAFASLIIMEIHPTTYWVFTCAMAGADALLSIWLVWYVKQQDVTFPGNTWHMILPWIRLIAV